MSVCLRLRRVRRGRWEGVGSGTQPNSIKNGKVSLPFHILPPVREIPSLSCTWGVCREHKLSCRKSRAKHLSIDIGHAAAILSQEIKKLCICTASLVLTERLTVRQQSFFNLPRQNGRRVTKVFWEEKYMLY